MFICAQEISTGYVNYGLFCYWVDLHNQWQILIADNKNHTIIVICS